MESKIEQPSIEDVKALDGRDVAMLNDKEQTAYQFYLHQGRKYGVSLGCVSEAPKEELAKANSTQQYNEIVSRYPSTISVRIASD